MRAKVKVAPAEQMVNGDCRHYWVIDSPKGPTSLGVCRFCGAEKEFQNFMPELMWEGDQSFLFKSFDVKDNKPDEKWDDS